MPCLIQQPRQLNQSTAEPGRTVGHSSIPDNLKLPMDSDSARNPLGSLSTRGRFIDRSAARSVYSFPIAQARPLESALRREALASSHSRADRGHSSPEVVPEQPAWFAVGEVLPLARWPTRWQPLTSLPPTIISPHENVVVHVVKESLDVHVHDPAFCLLGHNPLSGLDRVMCASAWPKPPAMLAEGRLVQRLQFS
jgi:hypothetical protein